MGNAFYYGVCNRILCKMTLWLSCFMLVRNTAEAIVYRTIFHGGNLWWHWFGNTRAVLLSTQPNKVYAWANRRIGGNVWEKSVPGCVDERGSGKETRYWWIKSAGKRPSRDFKQSHLPSNSQAFVLLQARRQLIRTRYFSTYETVKSKVLMKKGTVARHFSQCRQI